MNTSRFLAPLEQMLWTLDKGCCMNFVMIAEISGSFTETNLKNALQKAQQRHPLLQAKVEAQGRKFRFVFADVGAIPLTIVELPSESWNKNIWLSDVEKQLREPFSESGPLLRCIWLRSGTENILLPVFHHAIGDGFSGIFLVRDILQFMADEIAGKNHPVEVLPALETQEDLYPKWAKGLRGLWGLWTGSLSYVLDFLKYGAPKMVVNAKNTPYNKRYPRVVPQILDEKLTKKLVDRAKKENTTVHAALMTAVSLAAIAQMGNGKTKTVTCVSPMNIRALLSRRVGEDVGFWISPSGLISFMRANPTTPFWDVARHAREGIKKKQDQGIFLNLMRATALQVKLVWSFLGFGKNGASRMCAIFEAIAPRGFVLTNLGVLNTPEIFGNLRLSALHFAVTPGALANFALTVTTFRGKLSINFTYMEPQISREQAEKLVSDAIKILENASC